MFPPPLPNHAGWFTYIPATGEVLVGKHFESYNSAALASYRAGYAPPMDLETAYYDPETATDGISVVDGDKLVPVSKAIKSETVQPASQIQRPDLLTDYRTIAFLPSFIKAVEHPSLLHYMFSPVPLTSCRDNVMLPGSYSQIGPMDVNELRDAVVDYAEFDARMYDTWIPGSIDRLYDTPDIFNHHVMGWILYERMEKHNKEALEALDTIKHVELIPMPENNFKDSAKELKHVLDTQLEQHGSRITHIAMGDGMCKRLLGPELRNAAAKPCPYGMSGTMLDLWGIKIITDGMIDVHEPDTMYAVSRHGGALYGQGPILAVTTNFGYDDPMTKISEFFQYVIVDNFRKPGSGQGQVDKRTAFKIKIE